MKENLKIVEFPTHEYPRAGGESYAKSIPTGVAFLKLFWRELRLTKEFRGMFFFLNILFFGIVAWAVLGLFNANNVTSHPEYHRWIYRAVSNGISLEPMDFLRGFDPVSFDGWIRPRFLGYMVTVLNVKFRLFLYNFFIPFPNLSLHLILALFLAPIFFYKFAKNILRSKSGAIYATGLYVASVGFLSNLTFLFQPAKALGHLATVILFYLLSELQKTGRGAMLSGKNWKLILAILILNFFGVSMDEGYLVTAVIGVIVFYELFLPKKINPEELKRTLFKGFVYFLPFLLFLIFVVAFASQITAYIGAGKWDYIEWAMAKNKEMSQAPFLPFAYKIFITNVASSFTPILFLGDQLPIMLKSVWNRENIPFFLMFVGVLSGIAIFKIYNLFSRNHGDESQFDLKERKYYRKQTLIWAVAMFFFLAVQSMLMRMHPVVSGTYYYSSLFSVFTPIFVMFFLGKSRTYMQGLITKLAVVIFLVVQLVNFHDLNSRWMLFHQNWIYLESSQKFSYLLKSPDLINNEKWLGKVGLLFDYKNKNGLDILDNSQEHKDRVRNLWMRWKKGEAVDMGSDMDGFTDRDALFLHEMDVLVNKKSK
jgi:hypothetical protein